MVLGTNTAPIMANVSDRVMASATVAGMSDDRQTAAASAPSWPRELSSVKENGAEKFGSSPVES
jgi:hypothetical protein